MLELVRDLVAFIRFRKKYWMIPLLALLLTIGMVAVLAPGTPLAPFIYALF